MKKSVVYGVLSVFLFIALLSQVSGEIIISQPDSKYNLGDNLDIKLQVKKAVETNDFLKVNLLCDSDSMALYMSPLRVSPSKTENITLSAKLDRSLISNTEGSCNIYAEYGDEYITSSSFEISDKIDLIVKINSNSFDPGQDVYVSGTAIKENGEKINGFLQMSLSATNVSFLSNLESNNFNYSFRIPQNQATGGYSLVVKVYEREVSGEIANEGIYSESIKVNQVIRSGEVSISSPSVYPLENISYSIILKDQSGNEIKTDVNSIVYTSEITNNIFSRKTAKSSDLIYIEIPKNATPGKWEIEGLYSSLPLNRTFNVLPLSKASFYIENQELVIINEGNVIYNESIVVFIGGTPERPELSIPVSSSKRFRIDAPTGDYNVEIKDGAGNNFDLGEVTINQTTKSPGFGSLLTGNAIGLSDPNSATTSYFKIIFWLIIIIILLYVAVYYYKRVRKNRFYAKKPQSLSSTSLAYKTLPKKYSQNESEDYKEERIVQLRKVNNEPKEEMQEEIEKPKLLFNTYNPKDEESSSGQDYSAKKEEVIVLALKVKNGQKLRQSESSAFNAIRNALHKAKVAKAKVYDQGDTNLVVFSKSLSDKSDALEAAKIAHSIDLTLRDFNKKYAIKIDYGLGMHSGEMFFEMIDGKAKFTSIGNVTIAPKNMAAKAECELLVSQQIYRKIYAVVKAEQESEGYYKIISFKDRSSHSQFIDKFMGNTSDKKNETNSHHTAHKVVSQTPHKSHSRFASEHGVISKNEKKIKDSGIHPPAKKNTFQRY